MEAIVIIGEVVLLCIFVTPFLCLLSEVSTFWKHEELDRIIDGVEVVEFILELDTILFPLAIYEEKDTHLHTMAYKR